MLAMVDCISQLAAVNVHSFPFLGLSASIPTGAGAIPEIRFATTTPWPEELLLTTSPLVLQAPHDTRAAGEERENTSATHAGAAVLFFLSKTAGSGV